MTAAVVLPVAGSPFDLPILLICLLLMRRAAELELKIQDLTDALAGARKSCEREQDDHAVTRLRLPRPGREAAP